MRSRNSDSRCARRQVMPLTALVMLTCAPLWAAPQADSSAVSGAESAVWAPRKLNFAYTGFSTIYSCDGLRDKMKRILVKLGAGPGLSVRAFGCTRLGGRPDQLASVEIKMNVLQPVGNQDHQAVAARWKRVDLLANRDPVDAAADCELIEQIKEKVLPLFTTRNVDYGATCEVHKLLVGATRLKAEVLIAEQGGTADSAAR